MWSDPRFDLSEDDAAIQRRTPPSVGVLTSPTRCLEVNAQWASYLAGVIERLVESDAWSGTDTEVRTAQSRLCEILAQLGTECTGGGGVSDYVLQDIITLDDDYSSYLVSDLDALDGKDLRLELRVQHLSTGVEECRFELNGDSTSTYDNNVQTFRSSQTDYLVNNTSYGRIPRAVPGASTQADFWAYLTLDIPDFLRTDIYHIVRMAADAYDSRSAGRVSFRATGAISSIELWSQTNDLVAGSTISVYTRGT